MTASVQSARAGRVRELLLLSRDTLLGRVDVLEHAAVELLTTGTLQPDERDDARLAAHRLISLGSFGLDRGSVLARRAEELLLQEHLSSSTGVALAEAALELREAVLHGADREVDDPAPAGRDQAPHVLLVEDDLVLVALLTRALEAAGCHVSHTGNGRAALSVLIDQAPPALVLLDIDLPGADGFSVLRGMRAAGLLDRVTVLVLSARGAEHDLVDTLALGAAAHITKPFSLPVLLAKVEQILGRR